MQDERGVVFDAGVVLQAGLRPRGPAGRLLLLLDQGLFTLYVGAAGLAEYEDVLRRPSVRAKNPHLTEELAAAIVERIRQHSTLLDRIPSRFQYPRDPKDEHVINLAIEAGARYIVSRDNDLLDLMDAGRPEGREFRARFPNIIVLDPVDFLRVLDVTRTPDGGAA